MKETKLCQSNAAPSLSRAGLEELMSRGMPALAALVLVACQSQPPAQQAPPVVPGSGQVPGATTQPPALAARPVPGGTITIGLDGEPPTLDPGASNQAFTFTITSSVGESLLYFDEQHVIQPWLAEAWEITDGGATFTFNLRKDVTFQDGTPFTATPVKSNFH